MTRDAVTEDLEEGIRHHRGGAVEDAEDRYRRVLACQDMHPVALHLLGAILLQQGRNAEAVELLRRGAARGGAPAVLLVNLGEAQRRLGQRTDALANLRRAVTLEPGLAEGHYNLAFVLQEEGLHEEAVTHLERALERKPGLPASAHEKLALSLWALDRLDESLAAWTRAVEVAPGSASAHHGLGNALVEQGRIEEALPALRRSHALAPDDPRIHSRLVYAMSLDPASDAQAILAEAVRWRERHTPAFVALRRPHPNGGDADRRLRVGYLSPHFRHHSHALFFVPLFRHHDRNAVEIFAYSLSPEADAFTETIRGAVDEFRDVSHLDDAALAEAIRSDAIDVLVDVTMHLAENRLRVFAAKPAPVQLTWLAYPGTTGLDAIDYRLTDPNLDPPGPDVDALYSERSLRLPETFWCYDPLLDGVEVNALPALERGYVTFGCLASPMKRNRSCYTLWGRVLRSLPGSRLVLLARLGHSRTYARSALAEEGVAGDRVDFVEFQERRDYFRVYQGLDVCLDTTPHGGGTTSLDSFWMGVPVVSLAGATVTSRAGLTLATNLGLPELAATSAEEFARVTAELIGDLRALATLRRGLRSRMVGSPLMSAERFARNIESAIGLAWDRSRNA